MDIHVRLERAGLEHHRDAALGGLGAGDVDSVDMDRSAADRFRPRDNGKRVGLPDPDGPKNATNSRGSTVRLM